MSPVSLERAQNSRQSLTSPGQVALHSFGPFSAPFQSVQQKRADRFPLLELSIEPVLAIVAELVWPSRTHYDVIHGLQKCAKNCGIPRNADSVTQQSSSYSGCRRLFCRRSCSNILRCLMLFDRTLFLHRRKLPCFRDFLIKRITSASLNPETSEISSKVIRSAHAAQIIHSFESLGGSGLIFFDLGRSPDFAMARTPDDKPYSSGRLPVSEKESSEV